MVLVVAVVAVAVGREAAGGSREGRGGSRAKTTSGQSQRVLIIRELTGEKKQITGFNGKGKLDWFQLMEIANKVIGELDDNSPSRTDLKGRIEMLVNEWINGEDI